MAGAVDLIGLRVCDVPPVPTPVPSWFLALAEAVAGTRLSARGDPQFVSRRELEAVSRQLAGQGEGEFYGRVSRWFLSDPARRTMSPF